MAKKVIKALRCKNYQAHLMEIDERPDCHSEPLLAYGWKKVDGEWLCLACLVELAE